MATYSSEKNVVFYHVPKTAGLFIERELLKKYDFVTYHFHLACNMFPMYSRNDVGLRQIFTKGHDYFCVSEEKMKKMYEFAFVRNPYTRFISGWKYSVGKNFDQNNKDIDVEKLENLQYVIDNKDNVAQYTYMHIFRTQKINLDRKDGKPMDFIGRFENLLEDFEKMLNMLGIEKYDNSPVNDNPIKYGNYKQYYTQEILDFVNTFFDCDFKEYGYGKVYKVEDLP